MSYYARELGEAGIDFRAKVSLPERLWIKNVHLSVLFGNALKNALEACGKCLEEGMEVPRVFLQAAVIQHALVLRMENSACQKTWKDEGGLAFQQAGWVRDRPVRHRRDCRPLPWKYGDRTETGTLS